MKSIKWYYNSDNKITIVRSNESVQIKWRLIDDPIPEDEFDEYKEDSYRSSVRCTIFLGYTSNLISSGLRDVFRYLVQNKMVCTCVVMNHPRININTNRSTAL
jgi:deoxyhypusine synthase